MDVYLVPASRTRYQLYCEVATQAAVDEGSVRSSRWRRMTAIFHQVLAEGERAREAPDEVPASRGRIRRFIGRKLAEAVAEQRLLWHLRRATSIRLVHPDDLTGDAAREASRRLLREDRDKHRRWLVIDGALSLASTPVALLPGPNVLAYFFIFRTVGHFLSMRGAQHGLSRAAWVPQASTPLADLRSVLPLPPEARAAGVAAVASALGLERLVAFVNEVADRS
jgi:Mitochondrial K+-H+ exchange-related